MQENKYSIKDWSKDDRPREKLLDQGAENLSNSELLAILLRLGTRKRSAVDLAREVLSLGKNNLVELGKLTVSDLMTIEGIGEAKAVGIVAALELGRRQQEASPVGKTLVSGSDDAARFLRARLAHLRHEVFAVLFLNRANKVNHFEILSEGGVTATVADPKRILKRALEQDAVNIILCHNHPSGSLRPSSADLELTNKVKEAAAYLDIGLLDHVIVSEEGYCSFADEGIL